jgi:protein TonB
MRLTVSMLAALLCHGVLFGVAAAVLSHRLAAHPAPEAIEVDVDVTVAKPDPIADAAASAVQAPVTTQVRRRVSRSRTVATLSSLRPLASPAAVGAPVRTATAGKSGEAALTANRTPARSIESTGIVIVAKPRYRSNRKLEYPIPSQRRHEEGVVVLSVAVDPNGTPSAISLSKSSGYPLLDRAALDGVHRWTFEPGRVGGVPVFSVAVVPVRFSLADLP